MSKGTFSDVAVHLLKEFCFRCGKIFQRYQINDRSWRSPYNKNMLVRNFAFDFTGKPFI